MRYENKSLSIVDRFSEAMIREAGKRDDIARLYKIKLQNNEQKIVGIKESLLQYQRTMELAKKDLDDIDYRKNDLIKNREHFHSDRFDTQMEILEQQRNAIEIGDFPYLQRAIERSESDLRVLNSEKTQENLKLLAQNEYDDLAAISPKHASLVVNWYINDMQDDRYINFDPGFCKEVLDQYEHLVNRQVIPPEERNLANYKTLGEAKQALSKYDSGAIRFDQAMAATNNKGIKKISENQNVAVYQLFDHKASRIMCGNEKDSKWCIGWETPAHFNEYSNYGPIFVIYYGNGNYKKPLFGTAHNKEGNFTVWTPEDDCFIDTKDDSYKELKESMMSVGENLIDDKLFKKNFGAQFHNDDEKFAEFIETALEQVADHALPAITQRPDYQEAIEGGNYRECELCGKTLKRDEGISPEGFDGEICDDCYGEHFTVCESCDSPCNRQETITVKTDYVEGRRYQTEEEWCRDCFEKDGFQCEDCDNTWTNELKKDIYEASGYINSICQECLSGHIKSGDVTTCSTCDKETALCNTSESVTLANGTVMCSVCMADPDHPAFKCKGCQKFFMAGSDDDSKDKPGVLCKGCSVGEQWVGNEFYVPPSAPLPPQLNDEISGFSAQARRKFYNRRVIL